MDIYGLIGRSLGHSFSRRFFTDKFLREGIDAEYRLWPLPHISGVADLLAIEGLRGFNVTIPYKTEIMPMLHIISDEAARIGAVNVVKVEHCGGRTLLSGYNTDAGGFSRSIAPLLDRGTHSHALILGTGGASKAVAYALRPLGIEPVFVSRTPREGMLGYDSLTPEVIQAHSVIVNATPLGTFPDTDTAPPIPYRLIGSHHVCFDLVYNPSITHFMRKCAAGGATVCNGLDMLRFQAEDAWKIWTTPAIG